MPRPGTAPAPGRASTRPSSATGRSSSGTTPRPTSRWPTCPRAPDPGGHRRTATRRRSPRTARSWSTTSTTRRRSTPGPAPAGRAARERPRRADAADAGRRARGEQPDQHGAGRLRQPGLPAQRGAAADDLLQGTSRLRARPDRRHPPGVRRPPEEPEALAPGYLQGSGTYNQFRLDEPNRKPGDPPGLFGTMPGQQGPISSISATDWGEPGTRPTAPNCRPRR